MRSKPAAESFARARGRPSHGATARSRAGATLTQAYNADQLTAAQDGPLSPDNLDVTKRVAMINEDGTAGASPADRQAGTDVTTGSRDDMDRRNRDG